jgi:hypothetical protein
MISPRLIPVTRALWLLVGAAVLAVFVYATATTLLAPFPDCPARSPACAAAPFTQQDLRLADRLGWPGQVLGLVFVAATIVARLSLALVSVVIFTRRADDGVAWLTSITLLTGLVEGAANLLPPLHVTYSLVFAVGTLLFVPIPFLFPNGHYAPRWTRWLAWPLAVALGAVTLWAPQSAAYQVLYGAWLLLSPYALIYRYFRAATASERQQIKWVVVGLLGSFVVAANWIFVTPLFPPWAPSPARLAFVLIGGLLYVVGYLTLAGSIGLAILRYRLWDIDVLIRRTLIYSTLTALLALAYFGSVLVLQSIFRALTGQGQNSLVVVLSTLAIAALFGPLRARVQRAIDRRFYRQKYDAARTLAGFAAAARDEVDLDRLSAQVVAVVETSLQPSQVSLWLRRRQR